MAREIECRGTYAGQRQDLHEARATVRVTPGDDEVLAKFDNSELQTEDGYSLGFGWHWFNLEEFELDVEEETA